MSSQNNNDLYSTAEDRANTAFDPAAELYRVHMCLKKSKEYWAKEIYLENVPTSEPNEKFYAWLQEEYGIAVEFRDTHGIRGISGYNITDEQKFLMFMLKFQ